MRYLQVSMHQERVMMSAIQPSAALKGRLMEQEQLYPCCWVGSP